MLLSYLGSKMKSHILFSCFDFSILNNSLMGVILHFQLKKKSNNLSLGKLTQKKLVVLIQKKYLPVTIMDRTLLGARDIVVNKTDKK